MLALAVLLVVVLSMDTTNWTRFALPSVALGGGRLQRICKAAVINFTRLAVAQDSNSSTVDIDKLSSTMSCKL